MSSDSAKNGRAAPAYVASKAALNAYMKSCARYYAKDNIVFLAFYRASYILKIAHGIRKNKPIQIHSIKNYKIAYLKNLQHLII
ncbi:TPA: hypothetical protein RPW53_000927 [Campylobacter fetus subsp. venerealis]|nr:hypothetical protein [Campylobacter fetus subsp. venerealis]